MTGPGRGGVLWGGAAALLALGALVGFHAASLDALAWQPSRAASQPWRAWSAAFAHFTPAHLAANLAGCAVVGAFGAAARVPSRAAAAWCAAWPLGHAALALAPSLTRYAGLSGVLHGGVAIVCWHLVRHRRSTPRVLGLAVAAGLALKLALEAPWSAPARSVAGWDFPVAPLGHATGAAAGLLCAWLADRVRGRA